MVISANLLIKSTLISKPENDHIYESWLAKETIDFTDSNHINTVEIKTNFICDILVGEFIKQKRFPSGLEKARFIE